MWPRGDLLVFESTRGQSEIWTIDPDAGGEPSTYLDTDADLDDPQLSADGRWMAYQANRTGVEEVYVPGEVEHRAAERRRLEGITLPDSVWTEMERAAEGLGVKLPTTLPAS